MAVPVWVADPGLPDAVRAGEPDGVTVQDRLTVPPQVRDCVGSRLRVWEGVGDRVVVRDVLQEAKVGVRRPVGDQDADGDGEADGLPVRLRERSTEPLAVTVTVRGDSVRVDDRLSVAVGLRLRRSVRVRDGEGVRVQEEVPERERLLASLADGVREAEEPVGVGEGVGVESVCVAE